MGGMARRLTVLLITLTTVGTVQMAAPVARTVGYTGSHSCDSSTSHGGAMGVAAPSSGMLGAQASIRAFDAGLCKPPFSGSSGSLAWIGLVGQPTTGNNIYQVGYAVCQNDGCAQTAVYYFYAYGWDQSATCGAAKGPSVVEAPRGLVPSGNPIDLYKVDKELRSPPNYSLVAYIDGAQQNATAPNPDRCWPSGINQDQSFVETWDTQDQGGGTVALHQSFSSLKYENSASSWVSITGSGTCPTNSHTTYWTCNWDPTQSDRLYDWDTRY